MRPSKLSGTVRVPTSKSQTMRALLFALLSEGEVEVFHALDSPDTNCLLRTARLLGVEWKREGEKLTLFGVGGKWKVPEEPLHVGESGIQLRFLAALVATRDFPVEIVGDASLEEKRPVVDLVEGLRQLGVEVTYLGREGYAPLRIQGPLLPGTVQIEGRDSQPVSSLLIASAFSPGERVIQVGDPGELPWVDLTLKWLKRFSVEVERDGYSVYRVKGGASVPGFQYTVPGDFSSAAFPAAAALLTQSELTIENIDWEDPQGDKAFFDVVEKMGAKLTRNESSLQLHVSKLKAVEVDLDSMIDALPVLAVMAACSEGTSRLYNARSAREKECDRLRACAESLRKMGAIVREGEDFLEIEGGALSGCRLSSYLDHRMAMALTVAGLAASGTTEIEEIECVKKTFPHFAETFQRLGAEIVTC